MNSKYLSFIDPVLGTHYKGYTVSAFVTGVTPCTVAARWGFPAPLTRLLAEGLASTDWIGEPALVGSTSSGPVQGSANNYNHNKE